MALFIIVIVITTLLNGVFLLAHYWLLNKAMIRQHEQVLDEISAFFSSPGENQPSQFGLLVNAIIEQLSARVVLQFKTTLMGVESVASKKANQVAEAIIADSNPAAAALMGAFPSLGKLLKKNPGMMSQLSQLKFPTGAGTGSNGHSPGEAYNPNKFNG